MIQLTDEQQQAVQSPDAETLVVSPAGGGKTTTLIGRVQWLIESGIAPQNILALTFTRAAAEQLRTRLAEAFPDRDVSGVWASTFHSACLRILRMYGDRIGYDPAALVPIDATDADMMLEHACRSLGYLRDGRWRSGLSAKSVRDGLERYYRDGAPPGIPTGKAQHISKIIAHYRGELLAMNLIDYGSMLLGVNQLLRNHPDVLEKLRGMVRAVVLDEGQDCDAVQYVFHDWFSPPASLFAVLDWRQSIYGWRGARPDLWGQRRPNATRHDLSISFRCAQAILDAANRLIGHNAEGQDAPAMRCADGRPGTVELLPGRSADIVARVAALLAAGTAPDDIAVLARSHRELRRLGSLLAEAGISNHHVGSTYDITETRKFREYLAAMQLAVNPRNNLAFLRLLDATGLDAENYARLRSLAWDRSLGDFELFAMRDPEHWLVQRVDNASDPEYKIPLSGPSCAKPPDWSECGMWWIRQCGGMTVREALDWFAGRSDQDEAAPADCVTLSTIHAAKGLEWPTVIVANLNEGTFPTARAVRAEDVTEERRCAYVAMTRARDMLILHYRRPEDQAQDRVVSEPSRFLGEAGVLG